jgi:hypothetical protein
VSRYAPPQENILTLSHGTLWVTTHSTDSDIVLVEVHNISSVVGVVPMPHLPEDITEKLHIPKNAVFVVEKIGLEMEYMSGYEEAAGGDEDNVSDSEE